MRITSVVVGNDLQSDFWKNLSQEEMRNISSNKHKLIKPVPGSFI